jgi:hypothetical protein
MDVERPKNDAVEEQKKPFRAPKLTIYGDLRRLTQAKGGGKADGRGVPATKV